MPLRGGEVEPVILGRAGLSPGQGITAEPSIPGEVRELDPLETEQDPDAKITLPVEPPGPLPAITLNRNFEGRQGKGGRTFLASPLTAVASAVNGVISDVRTIL